MAQPHSYCAAISHDSCIYSLGQMRSIILWKCHQKAFVYHSLLVICCHAKAVFATVGGDFTSFPHYIWWVTVSPTISLEETTTTISQRWVMLSLYAAMAHINYNSATFRCCSASWYDVGAMQRPSFVCSETHCIRPMHWDSGNKVSWIELLW